MGIAAATVGINLAFYQYGKRAKRSRKLSFPQKQNPGTPCAGVKKPFLILI
jgi:hypothetical protein